MRDRKRKFSADCKNSTLALSYRDIIYRFTIVPFSLQFSTPFYIQPCKGSHSHTFLVNWLFFVSLVYIKLINLACDLRKHV